MKRQNMSEISQKSGRSLSTVSKVLRNCPGVDAETRAAVRSVMEGEELRPRPRSERDICVILPDNPKFFWHRAFSLLNEQGRRVTTKVYSSMGRDEDSRAVAVCLEEAVLDGASAIIVAAFPDGDLQKRMAELARDRLILQFCEYTPIPNTFFVGADSYADGAALAQVIRAEEKRPKVGVVRQVGSISYEKRTGGFLAALGDRAEICYIDQPEVSSLYASHLARAIDREGVALDYLFCYNGITAQACDALYKLKHKMDTRYLGFELPPTAEKHRESGRIAALAVQRPEEQLRLALMLAERYVEERRFPDEKFIYLKSEYLLFF